MRLWTLHPRYLDPQGLVAAWREALLAQKVLAGLTTGYRHHPQLCRFKEQPKPLHSIAAFLAGLAAEADHRGYHFDKSKILRPRSNLPIIETDGQLLYEWAHLKAKLRERSPLLYRGISSTPMPEAHPLFKIIPGSIRTWEKK